MLHLFYSRVQNPTNRFSVSDSIFPDIPAKLGRSVKQQPSSSAHLMRQFLRGLFVVYVRLKILNSYRFTCPTPDVCHVWGGCGWHKHIPKCSKYHRQRDASHTAKLDLAKDNCPRPLIVSVVYLDMYHVRIYSRVFQMYHPCMRRELPCSIRTPANQTSRIEHCIHACKSLQQVI
jgi:hypothetical protein